MAAVALQERTHLPRNPSSDAANRIVGTPASISVAEPPLEDGGPALTVGRIANQRDREATAEPVSSPRRPHWAGSEVPGATADARFDRGTAPDLAQPVA